MSFQQKNAWVCLLATLTVFTPYFYTVLQFPMAYMGLLIVAIISLVGILIAFHIVNALWTKSVRTTGAVPEPDEMDKLIEYQASKVSGLVLAIVLISWILSMLVGVPAMSVESLLVDSGATIAALPLETLMLAVHILFAGFVMANLIYYGLIILSYRRLTHG